jgi:hypothetical protein
MHDALGDGQWERAKLRLPSEEIVPEHGVMNDCEIDHEPPDIGRGKYVMHYIRKADFGMPRLAFLLCRVCLTDVWWKLYRHNDATEMLGTRRGWWRRSLRGRGGGAHFSGGSRGGGAAHISRSSARRVELRRACQCTVIVEASPAAALVMPKTDFLLQVLIVALDAPAHRCEIDEAAVRHLPVDGCKPILGGLGLAFRPLDEQRLFAKTGFAPKQRSVHAHTGEARLQLLVRAFPPGDVAPSVLGQAERQGFDADASRLRIVLAQMATLTIDVIAAT